MLKHLYKGYGGVQGILNSLSTSAETGLKTHVTTTTTKKNVKESVEPIDKQIRLLKYGSNKIPPPRSDTILEIVIDTIKGDLILQVLIVGSMVVISLGTAMCPAHGWIDGLSILIAVVIVLAVTAGNDYSKDKKFKKLLLLQSDKKVKVLRDGLVDQISTWDILVGDIIKLAPGDEVPADGLYISGTYMKVDESPLTGETEPSAKSDLNPFMFSGCQVCEGSGIMVATGVGVKSSGGHIQMMLNEAQGEETALQKKLGEVAVLVGKIGVAAGVMTFLGLAIRWGIFWYFKPNQGQIMPLFHIVNAEEPHQPANYWRDYKNSLRISF